MVESSYLLAGVRPWSKRAERSWCGRRDSNPHIFRYQDLNLARLPVPPRPPGRRSRGDIAGVARGARAVAARGICGRDSMRPEEFREACGFGMRPGLRYWCAPEAGMSRTGSEILQVQRKSKGMVEHSGES